MIETNANGVTGSHKIPVALCGKQLVSAAAMIAIQGTWVLVMGLSLQSLGAYGGPASTGELVIQAAIPQAIESSVSDLDERFCSCASLHHH